MKRAMVLLASVMMISATAPVFAMDHGNMKMDTAEGARQCALQAETIQQKITRLNAEVKSGKSTHSAKEMQKLQDKLKETNKLLDEMNKGGN